MSITSRKGPCPCGSGKRFKHCCGVDAGPDLHSDVSDEAIRVAVHKADDVGLVAGEEPKARAFKNIVRALKILNVEGVILAGRGKPPIVFRIEAANNLLFRKEDQAVGGIHLGAIMFRDLFAQFYVPIIYGAPTVDLFELLNLTDYQKGWLASLPSELARFEDQSLDLMDFGYGMSEFGHGKALPSTSGDLMHRAHIHLEAAAATATGAFDFRGTIQSALLGAELALKAGLAAHGVSEEELRLKYGHDKKKAAKKLAELETAFDGDRVRRVVSAFPDYVATRYAGPHPTRIQVGEVLMGAQYVASEVTRRFSKRDMRREHSSVRARIYPA